MVLPRKIRLPAFTFTHKICAGIFTTCFTLLIFITCTFFFLKKIMNEENKLISTYAEQLIVAERLQNAAKTEFSLVPIFVLSGKHELLERFEDAHDRFEELSQILLTLSPTEMDIKSINLMKNLEMELYLRAHPGIRMRQSGASVDVVHSYFQETGHNSDALTDSLRKFVQEKATTFEAAKKRTLADNNEIVRDVVFVTVAVILACGLSVMLLLRALQEKRLSDKKNELLYIQEKRISLARKETVEVVAHDLKNPLSTIKMSVDLLLESLDHDPENKELAQIAYRSSEYMQQLINKLLDHAKIESGQLALELVSCNAAPFLNKIVQRLRPLANEKKISLDVVFTERNIPCRFDLVRMEQAFTNLIDNAIKFTPEGGKITCEAKVNYDSHIVIFSVADTGSGIAEEHQSHVFERFWQKRSTAKQGTGLGLAITKSIVEAHGGTISVSSNFTVGTTFQITVPLTAEAPQEVFQYTLAPV